jgi:hypothetical protein
MPDYRFERPPAAPRLLDRLRDAIRARNYSPRTADAYVFWARKFIGRSQGNDATLRS